MFLKGKNQKRKNLYGTIFLMAVLVFIIIFSIFNSDKENSKEESIAGDQAASPSSSVHGWNLVLVNPDHKLPENWDIELRELSDGKKVDSRIYPSLKKMFEDMQDEGVYPTIASAYRTSEEQERLMKEKIEELETQGYGAAEANMEARRWVAEDGYSEHQTGLAVDINADIKKSSGNQVYQWLAKNAWKYGFILRYPPEKEEITGTGYEPWHYRYVGKGPAAVIYQQALCLEEYVDSISSE